VAAVSAGNDYAVGNMISDAFQRVGRKGMVRIENGRGTENSLDVVEGMQFERGYLSPYFVTDRSNMTVEFTDCKVRASSPLYTTVLQNNLKSYIIFCSPLL
jgi:chaperonin GroEL